MTYWKCQSGKVDTDHSGYRLRNRCAHHESLVFPNQAHETANLDRQVQAINNVANWIEPAAAKWIAHHSRVQLVRMQRP
ncbi:hypothetical protein CGLAU_00030 [Corynebacterium glaucum]|uniref:Abi-like protein n=1 Tax=Corynebacterium glaucum TaxID=187491 RepID=A0A1Q2HT44_9CORY|nr:hypothetical protein CGLAU_00030 [Corynebacterium glaucum]WJZ06537.1 hypothetical protein CGLAUT_00040 [Corynebacterium glaucum]